MGPGEVYKGSRADRRSAQRQSLEINLRQEISGFKLLMTSYKASGFADLVETFLNKFEAIEELCFMIIAHDGGRDREANNVPAGAYEDDLECDSSKTLSKSLNQISEAYERSKERLNRDLNKMEWQVRKIKDTRERISMKHIKSLDLVEKEVNRIMPPDLSNQMLCDSKQESDHGNDSEIDD